MGLVDTTEDRQDHDDSAGPRIDATRGPFGLDEPVDAVAGIYRRAKATRPALRTSVSIADAALRKRLKSSPETTARALRQLIPESLARSLDEAQDLSLYDAQPAEALKAAQRLDHELQEFLRKD